MPYANPKQAREYRKEQARRRRAAGLCVSCGGHAEGGVQCSSCREKYNARRRKTDPQGE